MSRLGTQILNRQLDLARRLLQGDATTGEAILLARTVLDLDRRLRDGLPFPAVWLGAPPSDPSNAPS